MPRHTRTRIFCDKRNGIGRRFREPSKRLAAYGCPAVYGQKRPFRHLPETVVPRREAGVSNNEQSR